MPPFSSGRQSRRAGPSLRNHRDRRGRAPINRAEAFVKNVFRAGPADRNLRPYRAYSVFTGVNRYRNRDMKIELDRTP